MIIRTHNTYTKPNTFQDMLLPTEVSGVGAEEMVESKQRLPSLF